MKVIRRTNILVTIFYVLMALMGYFSTLGRTPDIVLTRDTIPGLNTDYFMIMAKLAVIVIMVVNCVTNYMPFRNNFYRMFIGGDGSDIPIKHNMLITAVFYLVIVVISIVFPKVTSILGIFGGLTSTLICYAIPCKLLNTR